MLILLIILQYFVLSTLDISDKFLISKRKVEPLSYTFYTVVFGILLAVIWPWVYASLPLSSVILDMGAGVWFTLAALVFYTTLAEGEVSRVVPFVYGIVPVFDIAFQAIFRISDLHVQQAAALCLLIPGALLLTYKRGKFLGRHVAMKVLAAGMISSYNLLWHFSSQTGPVLNSLIWNRVGATVIALSFLLVPGVQKRIFTVKHVKQKKNTSVVFLIKQFVGGLNFTFMSFLYSAGSVPIVDGLQGFRYLFLLAGSLFLSKKHKHIVEEDVNHREVWQKTFAIGLIFLGTLILFL